MIDPEVMRRLEQQASLIRQLQGLNVVAINLTGGWSASAPGATSGTSFTLPTSGTWLFLWGAGAFMNTAAGVGSLEAFIDGSLQSTLNFSFNTTAQHHWMGVRPFTAELDAGTHYFYIRDAATNLSSDSNDYGFMVALR